MKCIHSDSGLCEACQRDYDEDPQAWLEFGDHEDGLKAWAKLQLEMKEDMQ